MTSEVISHWNTLIENFNTSPLQFYSAVSEAITRRAVPDAELERINWLEGGLLSAKREYLRITRDEYFFDICAAPFGTGFFVSWWLTMRAPGCLLTMCAGIPVLRTVAWLLAPQFTHYKVDTALMFQAATHAAVLEVIDSITASQGIRMLPEAERKPLLREF